MDKEKPKFLEGAKKQKINENKAKTFGSRWRHSPNMALINPTAPLTR